MLDSPKSKGSNFNLRRGMLLQHLFEQRGIKIDYSILHFSLESQVYVSGKYEIR